MWPPSLPNNLKMEPSKLSRRHSLLNWAQLAAFPNLIIETRLLFKRPPWCFFEEACVRPNRGKSDGEMAVVWLFVLTAWFEAVSGVSGPGSCTQVCTVIMERWSSRPLKAFWWGPHRSLPALVGRPQSQAASRLNTPGSVAPPSAPALFILAILDVFYLVSGLAWWNNSPQPWKPWEVARAANGNVSLSRGIQIDVFCQIFSQLWLFLRRDSERGLKEKKVTLNLVQTTAAFF